MEKDRQEAQIDAFAAWLFAQECNFTWGADNLNQLPPFDLPEFAFIGRSNVGKSSLINALTNRNSLARTSHTPGRTQQLNFFQLGKHLVIVDMPGYGYAQVSKEKKSNWSILIEGFLLGRPVLKRVYVLIDGRHGLKPTDIDLMKTLDKSAVSYQLVLTKIDQVKDQDLKETISKVQAALKTHPAGHPDVLCVSSHKKVGLQELKENIAALV